MTNICSSESSRVTNQRAKPETPPSSATAAEIDTCLIGDELRKVDQGGELGLEAFVVSHKAGLIIHAAADAVLSENLGVCG